jgi:hypothetical protein
MELERFVDERRVVMKLGYRENDKVNMISKEADGGKAR